MTSGWLSATRICYTSKGSVHSFIPALIAQFGAYSQKQQRRKEKKEKIELSFCGDTMGSLCLHQNLAPRSLICWRNRWPLLSGPEADQYPALSPSSLDTFSASLWLRELWYVTLCVCLCWWILTLALLEFSQVNEAVPSFQMFWHDWGTTQLFVFFS